MSFINLLYPSIIKQRFSHFTRLLQAAPIRIVQRGSTGPGLVTEPLTATVAKVKPGGYGVSLFFAFLYLHWCIANAIAWMTPKPPITK